MNKFNKSKKKIKWFLIISIPFQFYLIQNNSFKGSFFIKFYSNIFHYSSKLRKNIFSTFPISIGDIFYLFTAIVVLAYVYNKRSYYLNYSYHFLIDVLSLVSIMNIFFQISWGLNYHSEPLHSKLNIEKIYSDQDLEKVVSYLIFKTNNLHHKLSKNDTLPIKFPFNKKQARILLANEKNNVVKNSIWSNLLSYMGYSGYLNPFTLEAQVNNKIPMISYLTTIAHEQSHQDGIALENESNYWAFKKTSTNRNSYIKFAGYSFALRYCLSDLYSINPIKAKILANKISPGVKKNFNAINKFWSNYKNPFEPFFKKTYDIFLKINNQKSGIKSYNEMVSLVVFDLKNDIE